MSQHQDFHVDDYVEFSREFLIPEINNYARYSNMPVEKVAMACFIGLTVILQAEGVSCDYLSSCVDWLRLKNLHGRGLH